MLADQYPLWLANRAERPNTDLAVEDKYRGTVATRVAKADAALVERATAAAVAAMPAMRALRPYQRQAILMHCVERFQQRAEELAQALCIEAGKPISDSRGEVSRLIDTFRYAAEESVRIDGAVLNLEISARAAGRRGFTQRVPVGPCSFIAPFNFPLNLAAHKIAPALAVGCPFVLKPASRTPVGALLIGEVLAETELPPGAFSILPCDRDAADALVTDERFALLSFTGSDPVGWDMKARAGKKRVVLELGGNAACIVDEGADIDDAVDRLLTGCFYQSGQSCIGVQRILIHASIYDQVKERLLARTKELVLGDPRDEKTFLGPMISESAAERVADWIGQAQAAGGRLLCGGERDGALLQPSLLEGVPDDQPLVAEEAFGPVAVLESFDDFDQALERVNASRFGLQAGVFTPRLDHAMAAWDRLEVGGVIVGDIPSWRVDHMPYGGVKDSGLGREGLREAMASMTEERLLVIRG